MRKTVLEKCGRLVSIPQLDGREIYQLGDSFYAVDPQNEMYVEVSNPAKGLLQMVGSWEDFEEYIPPTTLDELYEKMKEDDPDLPPWDMLPVFGGPDIEDPDGIWSWDETRMIVGTNSTDIRLVDRDDI
jgi:hypothetical protein